MKKNIFKFSKSTLLIIVLVALLSGLVGATAAVKIYNSNEITYDNTNSRISATDVQGAIDELYAEATTYQALSNRVWTLEGKNVVESGTSGSWTYKKYADGTFDMWLYGSVSTTHASSYGDFYQYNLLRASFPSSLKPINTNYVVTGNVRVGTSYGIIAGINGETTDTFNAIVLTATSGTQNVYYKFRVVGEWR